MITQIAERFILAVDKLSVDMICWEAQSYQTMKLCLLHNVKFSFLTIVFFLWVSVLWQIDVSSYISYTGYVVLYRKHQKISCHVLIMVLWWHCSCRLGSLDLEYTGPCLVSCEYRSESGVAWCLSTSLDLMYIKPVGLLCISIPAVHYTVTCTTM